MAQELLLNVGFERRGKGERKVSYVNVDLYEDGRWVAGNKVESGGTSFVNVAITDCNSLRHHIAAHVESWNRKRQDRGGFLDQYLEEVRKDLHKITGKKRRTTKLADRWLTLSRYLVESADAGGGVERISSAEELEFFLLHVYESLGSAVGEFILGPPILERFRRCLENEGRICVNLGRSRQGEAEKSAGFDHNRILHVPWELAASPASCREPIWLNASYLWNAVRLDPDDVKARERTVHVPGHEVTRFPGDGHLRVLLVFPDLENEDERDEVAGEGDEVEGASPQAREERGDRGDRRAGPHLPLAVRREREELLDLFHGSLLAGSRIRVDILDRDVTLARVKQMVQRAQGYHLLHWAGHGLGQRLIGKDGKTELTPRDLCEALTDTGLEAPALVFLSACRSGQHGTGKERAEGSLATALLEAGAYQVVVMRHKVDDGFARRLAVHFYANLLGGNGPRWVDEALHRARGQVYDEWRCGDGVAAGDGALGVALMDLHNPVAIGRKRLRFVPLRGASRERDEQHPWGHLLNPHFPLGFVRSDRFIGRSDELEELRKWIAHPTKPMAQIVGEAGVGTTALAAEVIHLYRRDFDMVVAISAPTAEQTVPALASKLGQQLEAMGPGMRTKARKKDARTRGGGTAAGRPVARSKEQHESLPGLLARQRILLVLDRFERYLESEPLPSEPGDQGASRHRCLEPALQETLSLLAAGEGGNGSKILLTTHRRIAVMDGVSDEKTRVTTVEVGALSEGKAGSLVDSWPALVKWLRLLDERPSLRVEGGGGAAPFGSRQDAVKLARENPGLLKALVGALSDKEPWWQVPGAQDAGGPTDTQMGSLREQFAQHVGTSAGLRRPRRWRWCHPVLDLVFHWVPPGQYWSGSASVEGHECYYEHHHPSETPARHLTMSRGYWIAEVPVTDRQYRTFVERSRYRPPEYWTRQVIPFDGRPVVGVDFFDATAFCCWLSAYGLGPPGSSAFGLPTEEQWELAARGVGGQLFPWGNEPPNEARACCGRGHEHGPARAGRRPEGRSPFGCLDMSGNVWEWCRDIWCATRGQAFEDGKSLDAWKRAARGGSFFTAPRFVHCAVRTPFDVHSKRSNLGFRVVCV